MRNIRIIQIHPQILKQIWMGESEVDGLDRSEASRSLTYQKSSEQGQIFRWNGWAYCLSSWLGKKTMNGLFAYTRGVYVVYALLGFYRMLCVSSFGNYVVLLMCMFDKRQWVVGLQEFWCCIGGLLYMLGRLGICNIVGNCIGKRVSGVLYVKNWS